MAKRSRREERRESTARRRSNAQDKSGGLRVKYLKDPDSRKLWKPDEGKRIIDLISFVAGEGNPFADEGVLHYERTLPVHRGVGVDNADYLCNLKSNDEPCGVCNAISKLSRHHFDNQEEVEEYLKKIKIKWRQIFWVFDQKEPKEGIQFANFATNLFGDALEQELDRVQPDADFFYDPDDDGMSLAIKVSIETFGKAVYPEITNVDFVDRDFKYPRGFWDKQPECLDDLIVPHDAKSVEKMILDMFIEFDDDKDEDEPPRKRSRKTQDEEPRRRKPEPEPDDDEDEEPEEKPSRRRKKRPTYEEGELVQFEYRDKTFHGEIIEVDTENEIYKIRSEGRKRPHNIGFDDETLGESPNEPPEEEEEPAKKSRSRRAKKEEDDEPPKTSRKTRSRSKKADDEPECPDPEGTFGVDTNELDACDDCPLWDACDDKKNG